MKKFLCILAALFIFGCASQPRQYFMVDKDGNEQLMSSEQRSIASHPITHDWDGNTYYFQSEKDKQKFIQKNENSEHEYQKNRMIIERQGRY